MIESHTAHLYLKEIMVDSQYIKGVKIPSGLSIFTCPNCKKERRLDTNKSHRLYFSCAYCNLYFAIYGNVLFVSNCYFSYSDISELH